jgi:hypothetical protein
MTVIQVQVLTDDEKLIELCRQYWQLNDSGAFAYSLEVLSKSCRISAARLSKAVNAGCVAFCPDRSCVRCGAPPKLEGRAQYKRLLSSQRLPTTRVCEDCERKERLNARQLIADSVRAALEKKRSLGLLMGRLSFLDTVFLASLLRVPRAQELAKLNPVGYRLLTPTVAFDEYVLRHLFDRSLICVHPETHPESIRIEAGVISEIAWHRVNWTLPLPMEGPTPLQFRQMLEETLLSAHRRSTTARGLGHREMRSVYACSSESHRIQASTWTQSAHRTAHVCADVLHRSDLLLYLGRLSECCTFL